MSFTKKFAALGAAAAISATGLVAAAGTSANAVDTPKISYSCDMGDYASLFNGGEPITVDAVYSMGALPALTQGKAVAAQPVSATITLPASVTAVIAKKFNSTIAGTVTGNLGLGAQKLASSLTIASQNTGDGTADHAVTASGSLAAFTPSTAGAQALTLPSALSAAFTTSDGTTVTGACSAVAGSNLAIGSVTVAKGSTGSNTAALDAAKKQLAKDKAALAKAKKALKKAKGHKKVVLKKKVAKLAKAVKADQAKVNSLS